MNPVLELEIYSTLLTHSVNIINNYHPLKIVELNQIFVLKSYDFKYLLTARSYRWGFEKDGGRPTDIFIVSHV